MSKKSEKKELFAAQDNLLGRCAMIEFFREVMEKNGMEERTGSESEIIEEVMNTCELTQNEWNAGFYEDQAHAGVELQKRFLKEYPGYLRNQSEEYADYMSVYG